MFIARRPTGPSLRETASRTDFSTFVIDVDGERNAENDGDGRKQLCRSSAMRREGKTERPHRV